MSFSKCLGIYKSAEYNIFIFVLHDYEKTVHQIIDDIVTNSTPAINNQQ